MLKQSLGRAFGAIVVSGEVVDPLLSQRGHLYFRLRDGDAEIKAVMWSSSAQRIKSLPEAGAMVTVRGKLDIYSPRGDLQLVASALIQTGRGQKVLSLDRLKQKLKSEGLLDKPRRSLPGFPKTVGVVTSVGSAVIHDIYQTVQKRNPGCQLILSPTAVTGVSASGQLLAALSRLKGRVDVVVIARGGGSFEELLPFSSEELVRAVSEFPQPVVSAVGHGSDVTLLDLVADHTAATPTAAAVLVTPDVGELSIALDDSRERLIRAIRTSILNARRDLENQSNLCGAQHPRVRIQSQIEQVSFQKARLAVLLSSFQERTRRRFQTERDRLRSFNPSQQVEERRQGLSEIRRGLCDSLEEQLRERRRAVRECQVRLHSVGPLSTLERGYVMVTGDDGIVTSSVGRTPGEELELRFADGTVVVEIKRVPSPDKNHD